MVGLSVHRGWLFLFKLSYLFKTLIDITVRYGLEAQQFYKRYQNVRRSISKMLIFNFLDKKSSPKNVRISLINILFLCSFATNLLTILFRLIHLYSAYSVLTLYKSLCLFVLPFQSFAYIVFSSLAILTNILKINFSFVFK